VGKRSGADRPNTCWSDKSKINSGPRLNIRQSSTESKVTSSPRQGYSNRLLGLGDNSYPAHVAYVKGYIQLHAVHAMCWATIQAAHL
jgi:hypothetical protein